MIKFGRDFTRTGGVGDPETTDLDRRAQDLIKFAKVHEVDTERDPPVYRFLIGDENDEDNHNITDWMPAGGARASEEGEGDTETHYFEKGERVVLFSEGGELTSAHAQPAAQYTKDRKPATRKQGEWRRKFKNGAAIGYDRNTGEMTLDATNSTGKATIRTKDGVIRMSDGKVTLQTGGKAKGTGPSAEDEPRQGASARMMTAAAASGGEAGMDFDLNHQLKGLHARVEQAEHSISAIHNATSKMHNLLMPRNPEIMPLLSMFTPNPGGLENMTNSLSGLQGYAQALMKMALGKFEVPTLDSLAGMFQGFIQQQIANLQGQLTAALSQAASIEGQIEGLSKRLEGLQSGSLKEAFEGEADAISSQIGELGGNPVFAAIPQLQSLIGGLLSSGGSAGNFMGGQENIVKGMIESVRFGGLGKQD